MSMRVSVDGSTWEYTVRSEEYPDLVGSGSCLDAAVEDLERKISKRKARPQEEESTIEMTTTVSQNS